MHEWVLLRQLVQVDFSNDVTLVKEHTYHNSILEL